eukprot:1808615-Pyramimonas_sp.AAC.1
MIPDPAALAVTGGANVGEGGGARTLEVEGPPDKEDDGSDADDSEMERGPHDNGLRSPFPGEQHHRMHVE